MILRSYSRASNIVNFAIRERGNRGGGRGDRTTRTENGRKGDKATRRKRDLTHCKAGDDNRLTSALSSSGSSSSLETQLIFVIMPHPHLPPLVAPLSPSPSVRLFLASTEACFLLLRYLPPVEERDLTR